MPFNLEQAKRNWERLPNAQKEARIKELGDQTAATVALSSAYDAAASAIRDAAFANPRYAQSMPSISATTRAAVRIEAPHWTAIERAAIAAKHAHRAAQLESQHFSIKQVNALRVRYFAAKLGERPLDVYHVATEIAAVSAGKYERGERLLALMQLAAREGQRLAETHATPPKTPVELKHIRLDLTRMGGDYNKAIEYAVSAQCSEMDCAKRVAALALLLIERAHAEALRSRSSALPAGTESPLSKVKKQTSGATQGRRKAGDETRAKVNTHVGRYERAGMELDSAAKAEIAAVSGISVRRLQQILSKRSNPAG